MASTPGESNELDVAPWRDDPAAFGDLETDMHIEPVDVDVTPADLGTESVADPLEAARQQWTLEDLRRRFDEQTAVMRQLTDMMLEMAAGVGSLVDEVQAIATRGLPSGGLEDGISRAVTPLEHRIAALDQFVSDVADDQRARWAELSLSQGHIGPLVDDLTNAVRLEAGSAVVAISSEMTATLETLTAEMRATMDQVGEDLLQLRDQLNLLEASSDTRVAIELERLRGEVNALKRRLPLRGRDALVLDDDQLDAIAAAVVNALGGEAPSPPTPAPARRRAAAARTEPEEDALDVPAGPPSRRSTARPSAANSAARRQRPLRPR